MIPRDGKDHFADAPAELQWRNLDFYDRARKLHGVKAGSPAGFYAYWILADVITERMRWLEEHGYKEEAHRFAVKGRPGLQKLVASLGLTMNEPLWIETLPADVLGRLPRDSVIREAPIGE